MAVVVVPEVQGRGRPALVAGLLLDAAAEDVVVRAERSVVVHPVLGHHEQADPLVPAGSALDAGEDAVHLVLAEIVLPGPDEDLGAADQKVVALGPRLGSDVCEKRAGVGLGEAHGPGELALCHPSHEPSLEVLGPEGVDQMQGAERERREGRESAARAGEHLVHDHDRRLGEAEPARLLPERRSDPPALAVRPERGVEGRGHHDSPGVVLRRRPVGDGAERREDLDGQLLCLGEDAMDVLRREMAEALALQELLDPDEVLEAKPDVSRIDRKREGVLAHRGPPSQGARGMRTDGFGAPSIPQNRAGCARGFAPRG